jgi:hypothetical protein
VGAAADAVSEFALAHVPGLLQTEDYARAALNKPLVRRNPQQLEGQVAVRKIR